MLKNKVFFFRINFDENIGFGHLARCLRIADKSKNKSNFIVDKNKDYEFIKDIRHNFNYLYKKKEKFSELLDAKKVEKIIRKKKDVILFVDDYRVGRKWHDYFRKRGIKLVVIDDLLNRKVNCDVYINYKLDQSEKFKSNLDKFVIKNAKKLIGPKYSIFDKDLIRKDSKSFNIMFNFGNSFDYKNVTNQIKNLYKLANKKIKKFQFILPIGNGAKNYENLIKFSKNNTKLNIIFKKFGITENLNKTDLFIGSASNAIYEMSYLKIPSIFIICNKHQNYNTADLENLGHFFLLNISDFRNKSFIEFFEYFFDNFNHIKKLHDNKKFNIDNKGVDRISRIIKAI
jgi:UDP-2,4-diacetamido-2,4,6-trideoxy-beta-L-altropyranose hydrolase